MKYKIKEINNKRRKTRIATKNNKYNYNGISFDSSWELKVYACCVENNIDIVREPIQIEYKHEDDSIHQCYPDFLIEGKLIEIKGKHLVDDDTGEWINPFDLKDTSHELKRQAMLKTGVEIWYKKDVECFLNKYGRTLND